MWSAECGIQTAEYGDSVGHSALGGRYFLSSQRRNEEAR